MALSPQRVRRAGLFLLLGSALFASERARSNVGFAPAAKARSPFHRDLVSDRDEIDRDLAHSPQPAALWIDRAQIQGELREWSGAFRDLDRALEFGADSYEVECIRAEVYLDMGAPEQGEQAATLALEARPSGHRARVLRGEARMESGLYIEAADDFGRALGAVATRPLDLVCAHASALARAQGGTRAALAVLEVEMTERGPLPSLMLMALEHERGLGEHQAALERLDRLRATGWSSVQHGLLSGDVLLEAGDRQAARAAWGGGLDALDGLPVRRQTTRASIRTRGELLARLGRTSR